MPHHSHCQCTWLTGPWLFVPAGTSSTASCGTSWRRWWRPMSTPVNATSASWSASVPAAASPPRKRTGRSEDGRERTRRTRLTRMARMMRSRGKTQKGVCSILGTSILGIGKFAFVLQTGSWQAIYQYSYCVELLMSCYYGCHERV